MHHICIKKRINYDYVISKNIKDAHDPHIFLCKNLLSIRTRPKPLFMLRIRHCYSKSALIPFPSNTSLFYFSRYRIMKSDVSAQREPKKYAEVYSDISRVIIIYIFLPGSLRTMKDRRGIRGSFRILPDFPAVVFPSK